MILKITRNHETFVSRECAREEGPGIRKVVWRKVQNPGENNKCLS